MDIQCTYSDPAVMGLEIVKGLGTVSIRRLTLITFQQHVLSGNGSLTTIKCEAMIPNCAWQTNQPNLENAKAKQAQIKIYFLF